MFRRQIINTIRRYSHNNCEKNIPQTNCNNLFEGEKKFDLIKKQLEDVQDKMDIIFLYSFVSTGIFVFNTFK